MKHVTSQEDIKKKILFLEAKYPVDKWHIDGVYLWPYIRIKLYLNLLVVSRPTSPVLNRPKKSVQRKVWSKLNMIWHIVKAIAQLVHFYSRLKQKDNILFGAYFFRVIQDEKYFNRFYDSIIEYFKFEKKVYLLEHLRVYENNYNEQAIINLGKVLKLYKLVKKLGKRHKPKVVELPQILNFYEMLKNENINSDGLGISIPHLKLWVGKIKSTEPFFYKFYKITKPKRVVFLGYYGYDDLYAALLVANNLGITTVDFQHGPQTNVHMAFSSWSKVPKGGYNLMPTEFWNWDAKSQENILKWSKKIEGITSRVIGQPYLSYWQSKNKVVKEKTKVIVYSMQTTPLQLFSEKMVQLIKCSDYRWILRLHPRDTTGLSKINHFLEQNNIHLKTIVQDAFHEPLPKVLSNVFMHVTNYSGCLIEAQMMGVPTILIHEMGREIYKSYIDNESVYYLSQDSNDFSVEFFKICSNLQSKHSKSLKNEMVNPFV